MQRHESWRATLLRSDETAKAYEDIKKNHTPNKGCRLCNDKETISEYEYWRLVPNRFPYDRYFTKSDMLIIKRHANETELTNEERVEFFELKKELTDDYDIIFENLPKQKSIPHHMHYHLVEIKRPE